MKNGAQRLTWEDIARFYRDGFVFKRGFFDPGELAPIEEAYHAGFAGQMSEWPDMDGVPLRILSWAHEGDSMLARLPRMARIVDAAEALLDEPCYHWHSKLVAKAPDAPGNVYWHAGQTTWYPRGARRPDIITCCLAVTDSDRDNGCLQVIKGSHLLGRAVSEVINDEVYTTEALIADALDTYEVVDCEMKAGDALFFHAQLLHGSPASVSRTRHRILVHMSYNAVSNSEAIVDPLHRFTALERADDDSLARRDYPSFCGDLKFIVGFGDDLKYLNASDGTVDDTP